MPKTSSIRPDVSTELRLVTDRRTAIASAALAQRRADKTRSSAIAEEPRDASCQLRSCQLPHNNEETTCTTSPEPSISCR